MRGLAYVQAAYYLATGVWAIVSRPSFEAVTGPKSDYWLVVTVSLQICAVGLALLAGAVAGRISGPLCVSAAGFLFVDLYYPTRGVISSVYLLDAAAQACFLLLWAGLCRSHRLRGD